jgi:UDP-N-acetylmuramoyl-tripeptide--D-alanyl-D-alanine ligase
MWFYSAIKDTLPIKEELASQIQSFCIDSRQATANSLFFALKGERVDGHNYLQAASDRGTIVAVVQEGFEMKDAPLDLVYVKDVKAALQEAAYQVIRYWKPKIIGITGSLGKTSTKDFTYALLSKTKSISATPGNYNTQLTLPLTILNIKKKTEYLLLEMGLGQPGEIDKLLEIAPPMFSILTMIAHVHIGFFDSFKSLAKEKMKIFEKTSQLGFYNLDMPFSSLAANTGGCTKISYSLQNEKADYFLKREGKEIKIFKNQSLVLEAPSPFYDFKSHYNLLAAIALSDSFGVSIRDIKEELPNLKHGKNRLEKIEKGGLFFISDAYNANLDSNENALMCLNETAPGRKIAILAEMTEQGKYTKENHLKLAELAFQYADHLIGYGKEMACMKTIWRKNKKKWAFFLSYPNMLAYISKFVQKGDTILLKGSRKFALERIMNDLTLT